MTRLHHSFEGFWKLLQISAVRLFAFVEGPSDSPFYDGICAQVCRLRGIHYQVRTAVELPGATGGKPGLLNYFQALRQRHGLLTSFKGKKMAIVFFLDKDVEDISRRKKRSPFLIYTRWYDVENHIIENCNIIRAAITAAGLDQQTLEPFLSDSMAWRRSAANRWKEWVTLCLFARLQGLNCDCSFGSHSRVNRPSHGSVDSAAVKRSLAGMRSALGLGASEFARRYQGVSSFVDKIYARDEFDRIFKGKWYAHFLEQDLQTWANGRPILLNGLGSRFVACAVSTLEPQNSWSNHFRNPIEKIVSNL
jgi:hypothetical protein